MSTDKVRQEASASPGDGQPQNREWFRKHLFEALDELRGVIKGRENRFENTQPS